MPKMGNPGYFKPKEPYLPDNFLLKPCIISEDSEPREDSEKRYSIIKIATTAGSN